MDKNEDLKYQLQTLECTDIETIVHCGGLIDIEYEDSHGIARFCTVAIPELGGQSLKRIVELEQKVKELRKEIADLRTIFYALIEPKRKRNPKDPLVVLTDLEKEFRKAAKNEVCSSIRHEHEIRFQLIVALIQSLNTEVKGEVKL